MKTALCPYETAVSALGGSALYVGSGEWYCIAPGLDTGIYRLGRSESEARENFRALIERQRP